MNRTIVASALLLLAATALSAQTPDLYYKYNDGTGSTAANDGTAGAPGAFTTTPTWITPGRLGSNAVSFASGNEHTTGYSPVTSLTGDFTLEAWVRTTSGSLAEWLGPPVFNAAEYFYWYQQQNGAVSFLANGTGGAVRFDGSIAINDGNWHHVAVAYDSGAPSVTMYVDGAVDTGATQGAFTGSGNLPFILAATTLDVCNDALAVAANLGGDWVGDLDDLRVWSVLRSSTEIANNYAVEVGQTTPEINVTDPNGDDVSDGGNHRLLPVAPGGSGTFNWTISNQHPTLGLNLGTITVSAGTGCTVAITTDPSNTTVAGASSTTLSIQVTGSAAVGAAQFTIAIPSNDVDENPYNITVNGSRGLSGTLTIINGGGGDYTDIGAAFDDLELFGVAGPTIFDVTDTGAGFTSAPSYELGSDAGVEEEVLGTSATNTIIVRAATGNSPVINGAGIVFGLNGFAGGVGVMFTAVSYLTFEGFECDGGGLTGGCDAGICYWAEAGLFESSNVTIRGNQVHNIGPGIGILSVYNFGVGLDTHVVENNMVWDLGHTIGTFGGFFTGGICMWRPTTTCVAQHNTVMATNTFFAGAAACCFQNLGGGTDLGNLDYNVFYNQVLNAPCVKLDDGATTPTALPPSNADRNVYYYPNGIFSATHTSLGNWQTQQSLDTNSVNLDPAFVASAAPFDLHLGNTSPAVDLATTSTLNVDIDGDARPNGANRDSGADENTSGGGPTPVIDIQTTTVADGVELVAYTETITATESNTTAPYTWSLTGAPAWLSISGTGLTATLSGTPPAGAAAAGPYTFDIVVSDSSTATDTQSVTLTILPTGTLIITTGSLPSGSVNTAYSTTMAASGGTAPYTWAATGLPAGLTIDTNTGVISGIPTAVGSVTVDVTVTDSVAANDSRQYTLNITTGGVTFGGGGGGGGGCAASTTNMTWLALLGLLGLAFVGLRRRREV